MADLPDKLHGMSLQLMGLSMGKAELPMPFGREIFLCNVPLAGAAYYEASEVFPALKKGQELVLKREPDNPHDPLAIEMFAPGGEKLGYIPRKDNPVIARLMDAGKIIIATLCDNPDEVAGDWPMVHVALSLKEI